MIYKNINLGVVHCNLVRKMLAASLLSDTTRRNDPISISAVLKTNIKRIRYDFC